MRGPGGRLPAWVWAPAALAAAFVVLPLAGVLAGAPWGRLGAVLTTPAALDAVRLSARTALASTALVVALGVPLALVLGRLPRRLAAVVRTVVLAPLVLPPVVSGLALLSAFGRRGLLGGALGGHVAYSTLAVVLAQAFVSLPFLVLAVEGALASRDARLEDLAAVLGCSPTRVLAWVTLPQVAPSLLTGAVLAMARAVGEFGATLTFAGSLQGVTRTLPLEIYLQRETDPQGALGLALLLLALAVGVVAVTAGRARGHDTGRAVLGRRRTSGGSGRRPDAAPGAVPGTRPPEGPRAPAPLALDVDATSTPRGVDVRVQVPAGRCLAVLGANGAGKSTLLGLVDGRVDATRGHVRVGGRDLARVPPHRRGMSLVAQDALLLPHLDVLDNVALGPRAHGAGRGRARALAAAQLERLGVGHLAGRAPATLSGGQAQRVALARALAVDPAVLLLDEPLAALDADAAALVREVLAAARAARPVTTLLVTHDPDDVRALADAVVVLDGGRVVEEGPAAQVLDAPRSTVARRLLAPRSDGGR